MEFTSAGQLPMLSVKCKEAAHLSFDILGDYIRNHLGEDSSKYSSAIASLNQYRLDATDIQMTLTGKDLIYKYYGQLELLELHFPVANVGLAFSWRDAFNNENTTQSSPAFEKASLIFNIAALLSNLAASSNRATDEGIKMACNYFECASGVFQYVSDNFLHAPSVDMSKDFLAILIQLMLSQAQECYVDKASVEKKKSSILAKLASQASHQYQSCLELIEANESIKGYCPPLWITVIKVKAKFYQALAQYHKAIMAENERKYGEWVGRLLYSESLAKDAAKVMKGLSSMAGLNQLVAFMSLSNKSQSSVPQIEDYLKSFLDFIAITSSKSVKENDFIYHDNVLPFSVLNDIEKISLARSKKLSDLYPNIQSVVGKDLFQNLVPMAVHEKSSMYSEEKSRITRDQVKIVGEADSDLSARLASLNLPTLLNDLKKAAKEFTEPHSAVQVPIDVLEWSTFIKSKEASNPVDKFFANIDVLRQKCTVAMTTIDSILDQDAREWWFLKNRPGAYFAQIGPETAAQNYRTKLQNIRESFTAASESDRFLLQKYNACKREICLLAGPNHFLEQEFSRVLNIPPTQSLLDIELPAVNTVDVSLLSKLDNQWQELSKLKNDRQTCLSKLKEKIHNEDINQILVLNQNNEKDVFKIELQKFDSYKEKIRKSILEQEKLLDELAALVAKLVQSDLYQMAKSKVVEDQSKKKRLHEARVTYDEISSNLEHGMQFYRTNEEVLNDLNREINDFVQKRREERSRIPTI